MDIREKYIKEKGISFLNNNMLNDYATWLEIQIAENNQALQLHKTNVNRCFLPWIEVNENLPINSSCMVLRNNKRICNLYFDGKNWMDDGFDTNGEKIFTDVTHYIELKDIVIPK